VKRTEEIAQRKVEEAVKAKEALKQAEEAALGENPAIRDPVIKTKLETALRHVKSVYEGGMAYAEVIVIHAQDDAVKWITMAAGRGIAVEENRHPIVEKVQESEEVPEDSFFTKVQSAMGAIARAQKVIAQVGVFQAKMEAAQAAVEAEKAEMVARQKESEAIVAQVEARAATTEMKEEAERRLREKKTAAKKAREEVREKEKAVEKAKEKEEAKARIEAKAMKLEEEVKAAEEIKAEAI